MQPFKPNTVTSRFQLRRLAQVILAVVFALLAVAAQNLLAGYYGSGLMALGSVLLLLVAYRTAHRGQLDKAATLLLGTLTLAATLFMWKDQGLRDAAMFGYCGILIFAGMLGSRRLFFLLLGFMLLSVISLGVLNLQGIYVNRISGVRVGTIVDAAGILLVIGFGTWLMASDLRRALSSAEDENQRVLQTQAHIEYLARHDPLTGLANRLLARDLFEQARARAQRAQQQVALLFLDLDNFKTINDSLGHGAGDELLCQVAERLQRAVRSSDTVCRQGGDEFLLVLGDMSDGDAVAGVALKVLEQFAEPLLLSGQQVLVTASLGVALCPDDGEDFDTLLKKADMAMYQAKDAGRNALRFYDAQLHQSVTEHLQLAASMRAALGNGEFSLHFQPQFALPQARLIGAEALLRWQHPQLGSVSPALFIPIAEKTGLIVEIGAWVIQESCRQAMQWHRDGFDGLRVSVNLSPVQFRRGDVEQVVLGALEASGLPATALELELTESLLIEDSADLAGVLHRLRSRGVSFSIDDFGTGYSNLGYLRRFEVECLKIDQSFIRRLTADAQDEAIVRAITQMAHSLKLSVVAEGIEDAATLQRLNELGCDRGQGYLWSPALPAETFRALLEQQAGSAAQSLREA